jgi:hypothetical protein
LDYWLFLLQQNQPPFLNPRSLDICLFTLSMTQENLTLPKAFLKPEKLLSTPFLPATKSRYFEKG